MASLLMQSMSRTLPLMVCVRERRRDTTVDILFVRPGIFTDGTEQLFSASETVGITHYDIETTKATSTKMKKIKNAYETLLQNH